DEGVEAVEGGGADSAVERPALWRVGVDVIELREARLVFGLAVHGDARALDRLAGALGPRPAPGGHDDRAAGQGFERVSAGERRGHGPHSFNSASAAAWTWGLAPARNVSPEFTVSGAPDQSVTTPPASSTIGARARKSQGLSSASAIKSTLPIAIIPT